MAGRTLAAQGAEEEEEAEQQEEMAQARPRLVGDPRHVPGPAVWVFGLFIRT